MPKFFSTKGPTSAEAFIPTTKALLEWSSPIRVFKPLDKDDFRRLTFWVVVSVLVLIFFREFVLALALLSLLFFSYIMGTVPPEKIDHRITENGITTAGHNYLWRELRSFYLKTRLKKPILTLETQVRPARLILVLEGVDPSLVERTLSNFIPQREIPPANFFDGLTERAAGFLNLA